MVLLHKCGPDFLYPHGFRSSRENGKRATGQLRRSHLEFEINSREQMNVEGTGSELFREVLFRSVETKLTDFACRGITSRAAHGCFW